MNADDIERELQAWGDDAMRIYYNTRSGGLMVRHADGSVEKVDGLFSGLWFLYKLKRSGAAAVMVDSVTKEETRL